MNGQGTIGIQITGTWVGTITFQGTIDGTNFTSLHAISAADATFTGVTTTTGNGIWNATVAGLSQVRINFTGFMSGTAVVSTRTTVTASKGGGGGGMGTGTVTNTGGALTVTNIMVGAGGNDSAVSTCTIAAGALSCPNTITAGTGSGAAGNIVLNQGAAPAAPPANSFMLYAPAAIGTSYYWVLPGADSAGLIQSSGAGTPGVLSILAPTDDNIPVGSGTAYQAKALPACTDVGGNHLNYDTASNAFSCGTSGSSASIAPLQLTGANDVEQYNGTNAQTFSLYNTRTSGTNYERADFTWASNIAFIQTIAGGGGGTARDIAIRAAGSNVYIQTNGGGAGANMQFNAAGVSTIAFSASGGNITGNTRFQTGIGMASNLFVSNTAPTISAGFCATSPSIVANNGTIAFTVNVGTTCTGVSTGTIGMPAANAGWACTFQDVTTPGSYVIGQTGGSTTTVTLTNYSRTMGTAVDFAESEILRVMCLGY